MGLMGFNCISIVLKVLFKYFAISQVFYWFIERKRERERERKERARESYSHQLRHILPISNKEELKTKCTSDSIS